MVDQGYTTFGYMKMQMVVAHGGRCAERVVFGDDITDGGRDDLEKITKVTRITFRDFASVEQRMMNITAFFAALVKFTSDPKQKGFLFG